VTWDGSRRDIEAFAAGATVYIAASHLPEAPWPLLTRFPLYLFDPQRGPLAEALRCAAWRTLCWILLPWSSWLDCCCNAQYFQCSSCWTDRACP